MKGVSAFGSARLLNSPDPISGISFRYLLMGVGILELAASLACFTLKKTSIKLFITAWMSTGFLVYRIGLWWVGWEHTCPCLGTLTDAIHLPPALADMISRVLLAYLLIGSYALLFWSLHKKDPNSEETANSSRLETTFFKPL